MVKWKSNVNVEPGGAVFIIQSSKWALTINHKTKTCIRNEVYDIWLRGKHAKGNSQIVRRPILVRSTFKWRGRFRTHALCSLLFIKLLITYAIFRNVHENSCTYLNSAETSACAYVFPFRMIFVKVGAPYF